LAAVNAPFITIEIRENNLYCVAASELFEIEDVGYVL
jgi:hypothetical protein